MRSAIYRYLLVLVLLVSLACPGLPQSKTKPTGTYQKNLGKRISLGTTGQCKQILQMMKEKPGKNLYTIVYKDIVGDRSFSVNLKAAVITRTQIGDGFGFRKKTEIWSGNVVGRLKNGASDTISSLGGDYREIKE